jgi:3-hydroxypropanoate dehydrogenase
MKTALPEQSLDQIFKQARTHNGWQDLPVGDELLHTLYNLLKWGPTSANTQPARFVFVKSPEGKAKLKDCLDKGNVDKTMSAPVNAIVAYDAEFYEKLPAQFPHADARSWFVGNQRLIDITAFRNGTLQGAYLILAARSLGLDCGPMSGFNNDLVDQKFFPGSKWKSNFLCNLGYGNPTKLFPRGPRLSFEEACKIV